MEEIDAVAWEQKRQRNEDKNPEKISCPCMRWPEKVVVKQWKHFLNFQKGVLPEKLGEDARLTTLFRFIFNLAKNLIPLSKPHPLVNTFFRPAL